MECTNEYDYVFENEFYPLQADELNRVILQKMCIRVGINRYVTLKQSEYFWNMWYECTEHKKWFVGFHLDQADEAVYTQLLKNIRDCDVTWHEPYHSENTEYLLYQPAYFVEHGKVFDRQGIIYVEMGGTFLRNAFLLYMVGTIKQLCTGWVCVEHLPSSEDEEEGEEEWVYHVWGLDEDGFIVEPYFVPSLYDLDSTDGMPTLTYFGVVVPVDSADKKLFSMPSKRLF